MKRWGPHSPLINLFLLSVRLSIFVITFYYAAANVQKRRFNNNRAHSCDSQQHIECTTIYHQQMFLIGKNLNLFVFTFMLVTPSH